MAGGHIVEHYQQELFKFHKSFQHWPMGKISQGGQWPWAAVMTAPAAEALPPSIERRRL
jgi:hypothetical protein